MNGLFDLIRSATKPPDFVIQRLCNDIGLDVDSKVVSDIVDIVTKSANSNQTNKHMYAHRKTLDNYMQEQVHSQPNYALSLILTLLRGKKHIKEKEISQFIAPRKSEM